MTHASSVWATAQAPQAGCAWPAQERVQERRMWQPRGHGAAHAAGRARGSSLRLAQMSIGFTITHWQHVLADPRGGSHLADGVSDLMRGNRLLFSPRSHSRTAEATKSRLRSPHTTSPTKRNAATQRIPPASRALLQPKHVIQQPAPALTIEQVWPARLCSDPSQATAPAAGQQP